MKYALALLVSMTSFCSIAAGKPAALKPIPLIAINSQSEQYQHVCQALAGRCTGQSKLWKEKGAGEALYLTGPAPELIKITQVNGRYTVDGRWDFSHYKSADNSADGELSRSEVAVFPALYPLSQSRQAVALVNTWSTGYSGGGREESYADFLMLESDGHYQAAFKNVPFSSHEMIRACFSEADYARKSHCHDESWSVLNLKVIDEGQEYYAWKFITRLSDWPSFTDKSAVVTETRETLLRPFQDPAP